MWLLALASLPALAQTPSVDVVLVPGCPTTSEGQLSTCLARRTRWAARLYELGQAPRFIASGDATHNPYVEAEALAAGMVALGVPAELITLERHALHTDENVGYALQLARAHGWDRIGIASTPSHVRGCCAMMRAWGQPCTPMPMDRRWVRHQPPPPPISLSPQTPWLPLRERERRIAEVRGWRRPNSFIYYLWSSLPFVHRAPPTVPPGGWLAD